MPPQTPTGKSASRVFYEFCPPNGLMLLVENRDFAQTILPGDSYVYTNTRNGTVSRFRVMHVDSAQGRFYIIPALPSGNPN